MLFPPWTMQVHDRARPGPRARARRLTSTRPAPPDAPARAGPAAPAAPPPTPAAPSVPAPDGALARQQDRPEQDEDQRERAGGGFVETDLELVVDLGRQGLVAEDLEGAELGEHTRPTRMAPPEDGEAGPGPPSRSRTSGCGPSRGCAPPPLGPGRPMRRLAATGRYTRGYTATVITRTAAQKPPIEGKTARQPKLTTKSGIPSGMTTSTANIRRHGRSVRSMNQAASCRAPRTLQSRPRPTKRCSTPAPRSDGGTAGPELSPSDLDGLDHEEHERHEDDHGDETGQHGQQRRRPTAARTVVPGMPVAAHKSWASCSSLIASAPVPSSAIEMLLGCSFLKGVSGWAVVTPDAIGYS